MSLLGEFLAALVPDGFDFGMGKRADRRRIAEGKVRCVLRASRGRVLNIGTEWSGGVGTLMPGLLRFEPQIGVVGVREIPVHGIRSIEAGTVEHVVVPWQDSAHFAIDTGSGEVQLIVPAPVAGEVRKRLRPVLEG